MLRLALISITALFLFAPNGGIADTSAPGVDASQLDFGDRDRNLPNVAIVATGGTIAEKAGVSGGAKPALSGADLVAAVPELKTLANIGVLEYSNIDSSHMTPEMWAGLGRTVNDVLARRDVAGVVVTHGTDTMAEGAWFLEMTRRKDKPVVFTGAMNAASSRDPDGPNNLLNAVTQVLSPAARDWPVTVTLNRYVNAARWVRKTHTTNVQTFESGEQGYLGYVYDGEVQRFHEGPETKRLPIPDALPEIAYLATFAGDDGRYVRQAIASGVQGLVIDAVGAGNVNPALAKAISEAIAKGIVVVITSRVDWGAVEPSYGDVGGGADLLKRGCILGGNLDGPKARLLLMLGIAQHGSNTAKLSKLFET